ncbi:hypothetical protein [Erythrobacter sp. YT30]|uniref:hypothetical protein n=1 Tax=Erythrobacter sp. YT30 TaxID=1735012 RepID=UPI00076BCA35|nr:hypothetical protein [Erythrobacter sp. YT30]KWV90938.1 hypothetical protein AUC45_06285 [Erythrobacter sp. YT30]
MTKTTTIIRARSTQMNAFRVIMLAGVSTTACLTVSAHAAAIDTARSAAAGKAPAVADESTASALETMQSSERGNRANVFTADPDIQAEADVLVLEDGMQITLDAEEERTIENPYSVKVRTDQIHVDPILSVALRDATRTVLAGSEAVFVTYSNYPAFIEKGEIRIFRQGVSADSEPLQIIEVNKHGTAKWTPPVLDDPQLYFVYRVYDEDGQFDQTHPHELTIIEQEFIEEDDPVLSTFGSLDEAAIRNISVERGTTITVTGKAKPSDNRVVIAGQSVPIDEEGFFVSQQIISRDTESVEVLIGIGDTVNFAAQRDVEAEKDDWFIVGQGDLTFISANGGATAVEVSGDPLTDGENVASRAAFYAKGRLKSGVTITGALDTGETLLEDIFSNLDRKDPRQLLRRLDSDEFYTTYGDDSTLVEDAPTQGRFYLKVEKNQSSLLIGNFIADIEQAELAQLNRGTFGAIVDHDSMATTEFGAKKFEFTAFASDPGTIPGRDEFRGTGGSLYFLNRRDITLGSERLSVEIRDLDTGLVLSRRDLRPQEDYDIDYFQGRIVLLSPLSSFTDDGSLVRQSSAPGNVPVLVARYEYTPAVGDVSGYTLGGRVSGWIGDTLRLGATAQRETTDAADQTLIAADATVRIHAGTYAKAEFAQSEGPGFGQNNSVDGGLSFTNLGATGVADISANAYRGEIAMDFGELTGSNDDLGKLTAFYENFEAGFSANGQLTQTDTTRWGAALDAKLGDTTRLGAEIEMLDGDGVGDRTIATADLAQSLDNETTVTIGLRHDDQTAGLLNTGLFSAGVINSAIQEGQRTDAALQLDYDPQGKNWSIYGFGQVTLDRDNTRQRNNRFGAGGKVEVSDRVTMSGELSEGDGGLGAAVELAHRYGNGSEAYLGYALLSDRNDLGVQPLNSLANANRGTLTLGARHRFNTALSIFGENRIEHAGPAPALVRSFGLNWDPSERWSLSGSFENGRIDDVNTGEFKRTAFTVGLGYTDEKFQFATNVEGRFEEGENRNQDVWLVRNTASVQVHTDWRALGRLNFALADSETDDVRLADYVEGTIGFAYRPILHDRFNLLTRYTFLQDLGPVGQVTAGGTLAAPKQRSHVFSIDGNFDLSKTLVLGAKYAVREGSVSLGRESDQFVSSNTQLGVLRLDWRAIKQWDLVIETSYLTNDIAGDDRWGGLAAIYRHIGNNAKIGVGYSLADYSTDLTDQSYTSDGFFVNLLGKF